MSLGRRVAVGKGATLRAIDGVCVGGVAVGSGATLGAIDTRNGGSDGEA